MAAAASGPQEPVDPDLDEVGGGAVHLRASSIMLVWLGGTLGTGSRYLLTSVFPRPHQLPLAIFMINIVGAFLLGALIERLAIGGPDRGARAAGSDSWPAPDSSAGSPPTAPWRWIRSACCTRAGLLQAWPTRSAP